MVCRLALKYDITMTKCEVTSGKFTCPQNFAEAINTEGFCIEDIDDDSEIFVIQASADVDLTKLNNHQLHLNGSTSLCYYGENGREEVYNCITTDKVDRRITQGCLVLPDRDSMKLCAVKRDFDGFIFIEKAVQVSQFKYSEDSNGYIETPVNSRGRSDLLYSGDSSAFCDQSSRQGTLGIASDASLVTNAESSQSVRKKKHHRHLTKCGESLETTHVKNKRKHKHKKGDEVMHIQAEPLSIDEGDEFPRANVPLEWSEGDSSIFLGQNSKKGRLAHALEDSQGTDAQSSQSVRKKKYKHKKGDTQVMHIQAEPLSDDGETGSYADIPLSTTEGAVGLSCSVNFECDDLYSESVYSKKDSASKKKKKKERYEIHASHEIEENEIPGEVNETKTNDSSPCKPHKKTHRTHSFPSDGSLGGFQEHQKCDKIKHKDSKSKKLQSKKKNRSTHSISPSTSDVELKTEIGEYYFSQGASSYKKDDQVSNEEFSHSLKQKSKKKNKKKNKELSDD